MESIRNSMHIDGVRFACNSFFMDDKRNLVVSLSDLHTHFQIEATPNELRKLADMLIEIAEQHELAVAEANAEEPVEVAP